MQPTGMPGRTWSTEGRPEKKSRVVPLRIPENLDDLAALSAQEQHTDKASALRQWIHQGAAPLRPEAGRRGPDQHHTCGRAVGLDRVRPLRLAETHHIELGGTDEQRRQSRALAAELTQGSQ